MICFRIPKGVGPEVIEAIERAARQQAIEAAAEQAAAAHRGDFTAYATARARRRRALERAEAWRRAYEEARS